MALADKTLQEFLSLGVKGYCQKHHLQCCDMCDDIKCCDNTNPLVKRIKFLESVMTDAIKTNEVVTEIIKKALAPL